MMEHLIFGFQKNNSGRPKKHTALSDAEVALRVEGLKLARGLVRSGTSIKNAYAWLKERETKAVTDFLKGVGNKTAQSCAAALYSDELGYPVRPIHIKEAIARHGKKLRAIAAEGPEGLGGIFEFYFENQGQKIDPKRFASKERS